MDKAKLWTKEFILSAFINFLVAMNFYLLMIVISEYAMNKFGSTPGEAGFAASIFVIGALVARVFVGKWIMRFGYKKILWVGVIAGLAMTIVYFGANNVIILLVVRFFHGMTFGITTTATAIGPFLGMFLSKNGSYISIFTACAIALLISLIMLPLLSLRNKESKEEQKKETPGFSLSSFVEPKAIPISIVCLLAYMCYSSIVSFLNVYAKEINLVDAASFFFIVYAIVVLISRPMIGRMFDSKGENAIMYPAILIFGIGMLLFSQSFYGSALLFSATLIGLGFGAIVSSTQTIAIKVTPPERVGLANSTYYMFSDIGMGIGPMVVGFVIPYLGYRGMYAFVGIIALVCIGLYYLFHGKRVAYEKKRAVHC